MATLEIEGDWNIAKGRLKQKWSKLANDYLQYVGGKSDEFAWVGSEARGRKSNQGRCLFRVF